MGYYNSMLGFIQGQQGLGENQRQFDNTFKEGQRQFDATFGENQRQFDNTFREGQRQHDNVFIDQASQWRDGLTENARQSDNQQLFNRASLGENARQYDGNRADNYDRMGMDLLGLFAGLDQQEFNQAAEAFGLNQSERQRMFENNFGLLGFIQSSLQDLQARQMAGGNLNIPAAIGALTGSQAAAANTQNQTRRDSFSGLSDLFGAIPFPGGKG